MFGPRIYTPSAHGFFDDAATLMVNLASFNAATESFWNSLTTRIPTSPDHTLRLAGHVAHASFPIHALMHGVVRNAWPTRLDVELESATAPIPSSNGVQLQGGAISNMVIQLVGAAFLRYFERNVHRPRAAFPGHQRGWPELWRFAWLLRNAIAHSDRWSINDPAFPLTSWHGVVVGPAASGQPWFDVNRYVAGGDILLLLEELNDSPV